MRFSTIFVGLAVALTSFVTALPADTATAEVDQLPPVAFAINSAADIDAFHASQASADPKRPIQVEFAEGYNLSSIQHAGAPGGLWACNELWFSGVCEWFPPAYYGAGHCRGANFHANAWDFKSWGPDEDTVCAMYGDFGCARKDELLAPKFGGSKDNLWRKPGTDHPTARISMFKCWQCNTPDCRWALGSNA